MHTPNLTTLDSSKSQVTRRAMLGWGLAAAAVAATRPLLVFADDAPRTKEAQTAYRRLRGPMASLCPPFTDDYSLDEDSLRRWVDFMCEQEAPIIFFTFGDGEIDALTEDEIGRINLIAAERAKGSRTLVVGATGPWWTGRTVDFVKRMEDGGLEAINIHFSQRIKAERLIVPAFHRIADETDLPLLIYDDDLSTAAITRVAKLPQVVGVKSHGNVYAFYAQAQQTAGTEFAVLGAGQMKQYLYGAQVGSPGYLCPIAPVAPKVSMAFYDAVQAGHMEEAMAMVAEYEEGLLKHTIPLGYPQGYKAQAHLAGFYTTPNVRPPRITPTAEQLSGLKAFLLQKGWVQS